ncbi:mammalian cell entry protein [Mycobacterium sp. 236(2023)]|uniref:mammalian cell entry protein n=1 Tax=Mycobacterium sp. 236(2023) TaxID=3038163 RepID=UPI002414E02E|nr:mammalian cell entry protein [Mycobacterium sp. 236(2023)]MDG4667430.1 mammalian cell entry protein [Mycobacterium sp. 236(2023)]
MEDQQSGSGDLTTEPDVAAGRTRRRFFGRRPSAAPETPSADSITEDSATAEPAPKTPVGKAARAAKTQPAQPEQEASEETADEAEPTDDVEPAEEAEPVVMVPHRPAGKGLIVAAAVASAVFVGASGFAAAMVQPYLSERALVTTKLDIARTATDAITTLWTYTPDDMVTLADRASVFLGGDFADEYRRYIDAIVEPNKQAQVTNTTQVMGAAVESVSPPSVPTEATALVYTNSVATSPVTKNIPALRYLSYRLTLQREGGDWRITKMSTITSFDLTPQL